MYGNILQSERCCPALARFRRFAAPQLFALTEYLFCAFLNHWRDELAQQLGSALANPPLRSGPLWSSVASAGH